MACQHLLRVRKQVRARVMDELMLPVTREVRGAHRPGSCGERAERVGVTVVRTASRSSLLGQGSTRARYCERSLLLLGARGVNGSSCSCRVIVRVRLVQRCGGLFERTFLRRAHFRQGAGAAGRVGCNDPCPARFETRTILAETPSPLGCPGLEGKHLVGITACFQCCASSRWPWPVGQKETSTPHQGAIRCPDRVGLRSAVRRRYRT